MTVRDFDGTAVPVPRRLRWKAGASILAVALATAGAAIALPGTASAAACTLATSTVAATDATSCTTTGTAALTPGTLTMAAPPALSWQGTNSGAAQTLYDTLPADEALDSLDLRASGTNTGWHITVAATQFTQVGGTATLPTTGTLALNGGTPTSGPGGTDATTNTPSAVCVVGPNDCRLPANATAPVTYPVAIPTDTTTATTVYSADVNSGTGIIQIGNSPTIPGTNPSVWSVAVPAAQTVASYRSTITTTIADAP